MKYIIKNCPAISFTGEDYYCDAYQTKCKYCTACVLKQIIDKCNNASSCQKHGRTIRLRGLNQLADEILELLYIREVE